MSSGGSLFLLLDQPALLSRSGLTGGSLALDLDLLALVGSQLVGEVGLFGRLRSLGDGELLDVGFCVTGLGGGGLVSLDLAEVELLDGVRCKIVNGFCSYHPCDRLFGIREMAPDHDRKNPSLPSSSFQIAFLRG